MLIEESKAVICDIHIFIAKQCQQYTLRKTIHLLKRISAWAAGICGKSHATHIHNGFEASFLRLQIETPVSKLTNATTLVQHEVQPTCDIT